MEKTIKVTKDNLIEVQSIINDFFLKVNLDIVEILEDNENEIEINIYPSKRIPMNVDKQLNTIFEDEGMTLEIQIDGDVLYKITRKYDR